MQITSTNTSQMTAATFNVSAVSTSPTPNPTPLSSTIKSLVVDDNIITGRILSKILEKEFNHEVTCVISGNDALQKLANENFDIVFMDIDMPLLNGVETCIKIRNTTIVLEENRRIPIIAYTTNQWDESFNQAGMNGYIGKPVSPEKVQAELERIKLDQLSYII
ncbi:17995_t:CDS:2 [Funneliformis geosporum]|uniref:17556_t:CDS:1 n=1 Tax=Funneliformis geosporum TaxID=1117311 RepID=A0A9W4WW55_9GLOM|nr:17556_t:CDS:2 [Funneliformis geosporum]CAI2168218.1 17995_t:CDS:2 [Funneliformis geosporum]